MITTVINYGEKRRHATEFVVYTVIYTTMHGNTTIILSRNNVCMSTRRGSPGVQY